MTVPTPLLSTPLLRALLLAGAVALLGAAGCSVELDGATDGAVEDAADDTAASPAPAPESGSASPAALPEGAYAVLQTDEATGAPVTYSSCRAIPYVTNLDGAPDGMDDLVRDAVAQVAAATGLRFVDEGSTDEEPAPDRDVVVAEYGEDRWAPVLIAWADPDQVPDLEGDTAGLGGSTAVSDGDGATGYVSGDVLLDGPDLEDVLAEPSGEGTGEDEVRAVVLHELGHLVGLDHVDDATQLMYAEANPDVTGFRSGDLAGLALMGSGGCLETLAEPDGSLG